MKITHEYFLNEYHKFREIMCSTKYTPKQKQDAYGGLLQVYMACEDKDPENEELRKMAIEMLQMEFPLRMGLELTMQFEKLFAEIVGDTDED